MFKCILSVRQYIQEKRQWLNNYCGTLTSGQNGDHILRRSTAAVLPNLRSDEIRNASRQSCRLSWQDLCNAYQFNFSMKKWKTEKWKTERNFISYRWDKLLIYILGFIFVGAISVCTLGCLRGGQPLSSHLNLCLMGWPGSLSHPSSHQQSTMNVCHC